MGCTRKEAAEHAERAAKKAEEAAEESAKKAEEATDFANKVVEGAAADERAAADKAVKYAADERAAAERARAAAERARAAAERARAAAEQAPDEYVRSNCLLNEAKLATGKADDMGRAGPTGTWEGRSNKYNPCSSKAWRDKTEDWKQAAEAWARATAS